MRLFWVLVMVVLLPLRGWAGQFMALDMAIAQTTHAVSVVAQTHTQPSSVSQESAEMPADCPMHTAVSSSSADDQVESKSSTCSGCDTCELCLAMASFDESPHRAMPFIGRVAPTAVPQGFVSAHGASQLKPPIS